MKKKEPRLCTGWGKMTRGGRKGGREMTSAVNYRNTRIEDVTGNNAQNGGDKTTETMGKASTTRVRRILLDKLIGMREEEAHKELMLS
jgi:hypothetical protein